MADLVNGWVGGVIWLKQECEAERPYRMLLISIGHSSHAWVIPLLFDIEACFMSSDLHAITHICLSLDESNLYHL